MHFQISMRAIALKCFSNDVRRPSTKNPKLSTNYSDSNLRRRLSAPANPRISQEMGKQTPFAHFNP